MDKHLEMSRKKEALGEEEIAKGGASAVSEAEMEEAQEQIVKLKSLLATKREQIATLRYDKDLHEEFNALIVQSIHSILDQFIGR